MNYLAFIRRCSLRTLACFWGAFSTTATPLLMVKIFLPHLRHMQASASSHAMSEFSPTSQPGKITNPSSRSSVRRNTSSLFAPFNPNLRVWGLATNYRDEM
ncbi:hypothetical protein ARMGADRAFT_478946 [Armillaria gallica]|uniref:Uncharacterized protein n=1 Tax=Armillaria gallica TaxID=47427 RepID=A0A2H3DEN7_ARMGA|nr:hypothetical protein ARMGADRAFT_478946 [Armillaria gallica]